MKREDLKALGLTDEQIGSIMALHGQTVNELNGKVTAATSETEQFKTQLTTNQAELDTLKESVKGNEEITKQLSDLQASFDTSKADSATKIAELQKQSAIDLALTTAGARNITAVKALLDSSALELTDKGEVKGLDKALEALKADNDYLFQTTDTPKPPVIVGGGNPDPGAGNQATILQKIQERLGE